LAARATDGESSTSKLHQRDVVGRVVRVSAALAETPVASENQLALRRKSIDQALFPSPRLAALMSALLVMVPM
jgi:hypothetical protein